MSVLVSDVDIPCSDLILLGWRRLNDTCSSVHFVSGISGIVRGSVASSELRLPVCVCSRIQLIPGNQIQWDKIREIPVHYASTPDPDFRTSTVCQRRT